MVFGYEFLVVLASRTLFGRQMVVGRRSFQRQTSSSCRQRVGVMLLIFRASRRCFYCSQCQTHRVSWHALRAMERWLPRYECTFGRRLLRALFISSTSAWRIACPLPTSATCPESDVFWSVIFLHYQYHLLLSVWAWPCGWLAIFCSLKPAVAIALNYCRIISFLNAFIVIPNFE